MQTNSLNQRTETSEPDAYHLAKKGVGSVVETASRVITRRVSIIEAANEPAIKFLLALLAVIFQEWEKLCVQYAECAEEHQPRDRVSEIWNLIVFFFLMFASWALAKMTLELFQNLAVHGDLYAAGVAIGTPWAVDRFLRRFRAQKVVDVLITITFVSALSTGLSFALIRALNLAHQSAAEPSVTIEDTGNSASPARDDSDRVAVVLLGLSMAFSLIFFDLVGGQALHEVRESRRKTDPGRLNRIQKALLDKEKQYFEVLKNLHEKLSEAQRVEADFWFQFDRGSNDGTRYRR